MLIFIGLFGGLGLFIFGMIFMGEALQKTAGSKLKDLISTFTDNRIYGMLIGTIVTIILQSSSATTVMTVGFVNAGLMNLSQSIGVIMGSNIGTTVTAQLISFNFDVFAPLIIGIGVTTYLAARDKKMKNAANIFIGFGILFLGMGLMKDSMKPLRESQVFIEAMINFNSPVLGLMVGLVITAVLQSSAATTGLLIALAETGAINIQMAFPIILGSNIGTCVTAIISSVGSNNTAKRAAVIHIIIKTIGALVFLLFLRGPVESIVMMMTPMKVERQIANAHTIFNIATVLALYPFSNLIVKMSYKIVKGEDRVSREELRYIDERLIETTDIAIEQTKKEISRIFAIVDKQLSMSKKVILEYDEKICDIVFENERIINSLEKKLVEYIIRLTGKDLSDKQIDNIAVLSRTITDIERIADLAENLAELAVVNNRNKMNFSKEAKEEIEIIFDKSIEIYNLSKEMFNKEEDIIAHKVIKIDEEIKRMSEDFQNRHIKRIKSNNYDAKTEIVFLDALSNLERIGNHSKSITHSVKRFK
jgi:phosphate:Na+ symporter